MPTPIPARFERTGSNKALGCLVYLVVAPVVALVLGLFACVPLLYVCVALGMPADPPGWFVALELAILLLIGAGVASWGLRDYRRRAALEVVIERDRATVRIDARQTTIRFDEVASIRFVPTRGEFACFLVPRAGKAVRLPPEVAPFALAGDALEATLIPVLVRRLDERIARGEAVTLAVSPARLVLRLAQASAILLVGTLAMINLYAIFQGIRLVRHGVLICRQLVPGCRGGLVIGRDGLRHPADPAAATTPWDQLELIWSDPRGLMLRSTEGKVFALSSLADDFWPALRWIKAKVR